MRELRETSEKLCIAEAALHKKMNDAKGETPQDKFARMDLERQREEIAVLKEELSAQVTHLLTLLFLSVGPVRRGWGRLSLSLSSNGATESW